MYNYLNEMEGEQGNIFFTLGLEPLAEYNPTKIVVTLTPKDEVPIPDPAEKDVDELDEVTFSFLDLTPGLWDILVEIYSGDTLIGTGNKKNVNVKEGELEEVAITVTIEGPIEETGVLLTVDWDFPKK